MITFLYILLFLVSVFLVMIVLVQRGRGGGLAGAFGSGGGSSSAFGTKTGDVFTTLTVVTFVIFIVVSILLSFQYKWNSPPNPPRDLTVSDVSDTHQNMIVLKWTDESDTEDGYRILRGLDDVHLLPVGKDLPPNPGTGPMHWEDKDVEYGVTYHYRVVVFNGKGARETGNYNATVLLGKKPPATLLAPETGPAVTAPGTSAAIGTVPSVGPVVAPPASATASAPASAPTSAPAAASASQPATKP